MREKKYRLYYQKVTNDKWELLEEFTIEEIAMKCEYSWDHERCVLVDYTGLKDSNLKEIYESDIVDFTFWKYVGTEIETHKIGTIKFDEYGPFFLHTSGDKFYLAELDFDSTADIEVIGNIYQNPELLK